MRSQKTFEQTCAHLLLNEFRGLCNKYGVGVVDAGVSADELGTLALFAHHGYRHEALILLKRRMEQLHAKRNNQAQSVGG